MYKEASDSLQSAARAFTREADSGLARLPLKQAILLAFVRHEKKTRGGMSAEKLWSTYFRHQHINRVRNAVRDLRRSGALVLVFRQLHRDGIHRADKVYSLPPAADVENILEKPND